MAKFIEELAEVRDEVASVVPETGTDEATIIDDSSDRQPTETRPGIVRKTPPPTVDNLDDNPQFRKWKSEQDKRHAALQKQLSEAAQQRAWYEQQLEVLQTRDLDEPSKLAFENQKLKRMMAAITQQQQIDEGRQRIFARITARFGPAGVPYEVYAAAQDADEAWDLAADYALKQLSPKQQAQARAEKREANTVDLGGGATVDTDLDRKIAKAFKDGDGQLYIKLLRQTRQQE